MADIYVIRNLPYNLEEAKLQSVISQSFTQEQVQIIEYIQGFTGAKENTPTRCYVKIAKQNIDAFIDHIDGRPFINSRGVEERSTLEKVIYNLSMTRPANNKHNNTVETSKTFISFLQQLNTPEAPPPTMESLLNGIEKKQQPTSLIVEEMLKKKKSGKKKSGKFAGKKGKS